MIYIYSDESAFSEPNPYIGTAVLISDNGITEDVITNAMNKLINDPDRFKEPEKKLDDNTIKRGYFHASEDSKNAHSHLCAEINKIYNAQFACDFFDKFGQDEDGNNLYRLSLMLNTLRINTLQKVIFFVEGRQNLSETKLKEWYKKFELSNLMEIYHLAFIPHYFPQIDFKIVDKRNPGVQCTDFILWTVNRLINGDNTWFNRIESEIKSGFMTERKSWGEQDIKFGNGIIEPTSYYNIVDLPTNPDDKINFGLYKKIFIHAVKTIEYFSKNTPSVVSHLKNEIDDVSDKKMNDQHMVYLAELSSIYLKIFDMIPLINKNTSKKDKELLLLSKKYMALLLRDDLVSGMRSRISLAKMRKKIIFDEPQLLNFDSKF